MTYIEDLVTSRDGLATLLAAHIVAGDVKPTYSVDGRSWDWAGYRAQLTKQIDELNVLLLKAGGPQRRGTVVLG